MASYERGKLEFLYYRTDKRKEKQRLGLRVEPIQLCDCKVGLFKIDSVAYSVVSCLSNIFHFEGELLSTKSDKV